MQLYFVSAIFLTLDLAIATNFNVYVNLSLPVRTISDKFLSFTLDSSHVASPTWYGLNFTFVEPLARALGPAYFRFGGTDADCIIFQQNSSKRRKRALLNSTSVIITGSQLDQLYNFANNVGWRLIFGLNLMLRSGSNWDPTNAKLFLNYANSSGYAMDFELGNEPDGFPQPDQFNVTINGSQIATDYKAFRSLLNTYTLFKSSIIIGPSVSYVNTNSLGKTILVDFLNNGGGDYIGGLTFHHYFAPNATLNDFLNYTFLDKFAYTLGVLNTLNYTHYWLDETASLNSQGGVNIQDSFADGFVWLDKLGLGALNGLDFINRQQLYSANYALLNASNYPNPDYWLSLIYKKLVGTQVLNLTVTQTDLNLRLYAASSKNLANGIVVYGVRLTNVSVTIDLPNSSTRQAMVYILKEGVPGNLQSKTSTLNGQLLAYTPHQPGLSYQSNLQNLPVTVPGYSQFFIVIDQNTATQCPSGWYTMTTVLNKCLKIASTVHQPMFGGKFDCITYGNNAAIYTITNSNENAEVLNAVKTSGCTQFYIGLYRNGSNWAWSNSDTSTYRNWQSGNPSSDTTKNCVTFDKTSGSWTNVDCDSSQCYICQTYF